MLGELLLGVRTAESFLGKLFRHVYPGHFQSRISSLSMPST
jgi:hypothetical protein